MTRLSTIGFILSFHLVGTTAPDFDWCNHKCPGMFPGMSSTDHTMCIYHEGGGPKCRDYRRGLTTEEKQMILDYHNELRQTVANGLETRGLGGPQPSAADMMRLVWDSEVEMIAQRWADQCRHPPHDECRQTMDGESGGQNGGGGQGYGKAVDRMESIKSVIKRWYDEVDNQVPSDVDSAFATGPMMGHYTQVVWGKTTRIGCGFCVIQAGQRGSYHFRITCNYKPAGNMISQPMYTRGEPASKCPEGSYPSTQYRGLCETADMGDLVSSRPPTPPTTTPQAPPETTLQTPPAVLPVAPPAVLPVAPPAYSPPPTSPVQQPSTPTTTQPAQEEKKPSFLCRVITLPWRILKWFFSIPIRVYEFIKEKLFS